MPIYEFKCLSCGREFEELVMGSSAGPTCPACGDDRCEKWMSSFRCGQSGSPSCDADFASTSRGSSSCGSCASSSCAGCGSR